MLRGLHGLRGVLTTAAVYSTYIQDSAHVFLKLTDTNRVPIFDDLPFVLDELGECGCVSSVGRAVL